MALWNIISTITDPKFLDRKVCANCVDPEQSDLIWSTLSLFDSLSVYFEHFFA